MLPAATAIMGWDGGMVLADIWATILPALRQQVGARTFDQWLKHVRPAAFDADSGVLTLLAPSAFTAEQVESRFADMLCLMLRPAMAGLVTVRVSAAPRQGVETLASLSSAASVPAAPLRPLDLRLSFERFVTGRSNILAYNAARRMAAEAPPQFHPLYLRGETGQGKTHLLNAIVSATLARNPDARVQMLSAEKFMLEFVSAMRANDMMAFKARLRATDLLLIDDLQFIIGKDSTQLELLHTIEEVVIGGGRLVVAADRLPHRLDGIDQRLLSRLAGGLVADIDPPELELRIAILERKAAELDVPVPESVIDWIAETFPRNVRELEGALTKIAAYASLTDSPVELESAQARLAEAAQTSHARITIEQIQRAVCSHFRIDKSEMSSQRRTRCVARPRQVAMYLAKELTPRSYPEIGRRFGGRDHSTVIHAVKTIESLRVADADLDTDIRRIRRALVG
jgi:chromosomal replication initiator protein